MSTEAHSAESGHKARGRYMLEVDRVDDGWRLSIYRPTRDYEGQLALACVGSALRAPTLLSLCARLAGRLRSADA